MRFKRRTNEAEDLAPDEAPDETAPEIAPHETVAKAPAAVGPRDIADADDLAAAENVVDLGSLLVPLRDGTTLAPVSVLFAAVSNVVLPRLGRSFADRTAAMVAPFVAWLVPMVLLALTARPEGDVIIPGGGREQWVYYLALLAGGVAGMVTVAVNRAARR